MVAAPNRTSSQRNDSPAADELKSPAESIKETIDSIIIALALALVFRAFVIEAFVIPTGSMAPTLLGVHRYFVCERCGYPFDVGVLAPDRQSPPGRLFCPNCTRLFKSDNQLLAAKNPDRGGDKILVFKFPYLFGQDPKRWDVVVFYNPANPEENFIKRLIGRPGEAVQILDGKIYVGPAGDDPEKTKAGLVIQRKPPLVQQALWRPVYLNDFLPKGPRDGSFPQWTPEQSHSGWDSETRDFSYRPAPSARRPDRISFQPDASQLGFLDYSPYNPYPEQDPAPFNVVWDLKLEFCIFFHEAGGQVSASLNHRVGDRQERSAGDLAAEDRFTATFHQDGQVELRRQHNDGPSTLLKTAAVPPFPLDRGVPVALQNVDYLVTVLVDGHSVIEYDRQDPKQVDLPYLMGLLRANEALPHKKTPPTDADVPKVWIEAGDQPANDKPLDLRHISLYRDVYYTTWMGQGRIDRGAPGAAEEIVQLKKWGADRDDSNDEFFVMGDNSPQSSDGRVWNGRPQNELDPYWHLQDRIKRGLYRFGRVPRDHLIGQAFFVYWPAALSELPISVRGISVIPNVGRMRMIH